jgi:hypothetical protein
MINLQKRKGIPSCKGYYISKVSDIRYHYDSMTELASMMIFDRKELKWIKNTKLRISYVFEKKQRKYIPDFIIDNHIIIEIKGSNDKPELPFKIEAARKYCMMNNMSYELISYDEIKQQIDWNIPKKYHYDNLNI